MRAVKSIKSALRFIADYRPFGLVALYLVSMFGWFGYVAWRNDQFDEYLTALTLGFSFVLLFVYAMYRLVIRYDEKDSV